MIVIYRTKNGWMLTDGHISWAKWPECAPEILTFHNREALMAHLRKRFGAVPERDAKGHFCSTKKDKP